MPVAAAIGAVGSLGSGLLGYFGSQNAANAQVQAQQAALAQQAKFFGVLQGAAQPLINTGEGVLSSGMGYATSAGDTLKSLLTPGPNMTATLSQIPGFQFAQDWGQKTVQNLGTTMGLGGNTLKAGADYATGVAQQGFGNIVNSLTNLLGGGTNLAGVGGNLASSALSTLGFGAQGFSGQASNTLGNIGNAQASGILGGANAASGALTGGANAASNYYFLKNLPGKGTGSAPDVYSGQPNFDFVGTETP